MRSLRACPRMMDVLWREIISGTYTSTYDVGLLTRSQWESSWWRPIQQRIELLSRYIDPHKAAKKSLRLVYIDEWSIVHRLLTRLVPKWRPDKYENKRNRRSNETWTTWGKRWNVKSIWHDESDSFNKEAVAYKTKIEWASIKVQTFNGNCWKESIRNKRADFRHP